MLYMQWTLWQRAYYRALESKNVNGGGGAIHSTTSFSAHFEHPLPWHGTRRNHPRAAHKHHSLHGGRMLAAERLLEAKNTKITCRLVIRTRRSCKSVTFTRVCPDGCVCKKVRFILGLFNDSNFARRVCILSARFSNKPDLLREARYVRYGTSGVVTSSGR